VVKNYIKLALVPEMGQRIMPNTVRKCVISAYLCMPSGLFSQTVQKVHIWCKCTYDALFTSTRPYKAQAQKCHLDALMVIDLQFWWLCIHRVPHTNNCPVRGLTSTVPGKCPGIANTDS